MTALVPWLVALTSIALLAGWLRPVDGVSVLSRGNLMVALLAVGGAMPLVLGNGLGRLAVLGSLGLALLIGVQAPERTRAERRAAAGITGDGPPVVVAGLLAVWMVVVDATIGFGTPSKLLSASLGLLALFVAWLAARSGTSTARGAVLAGLVSLTLVSTHGVLTGVNFRPCDVGKCTALGSLYTAGLTSENFIALVAVLTGCFALATRSRPLRNAVIGYAAFVVFVTGSRTAILIGVVCYAAVLIGVLVDALGRRTHRRRIPILLSVGGATAVTVIGFYLLLDSRQDSFSSRGNIWIRAVEAVGGNRVTGIGASAWIRLQDVGVLPQHFAHSQYLYLYFSGGFVALALFTALVTMLLRRDGADTWGSLLRQKTPVIAFAIGGLTEVIWNPISIDGFTWIATALLAIRLARPATDATQEEPVARSLVEASTGPGAHAAPDRS